MFPITFTAGSLVVSWRRVFGPAFLYTAALVAGMVVASVSHSATVPTGFADREVTAGFVSPTSMTVLPDGRVLVVEQNGVVRIVKDDNLLNVRFYAVQNVDTFAERGCLGATPDPNFATNQFVYFYCTVKTGSSSRNRVLRVTAAGDVAAPGSEQTILELPDVPPGVQWHMGGSLRFGVDGKLYVAVGGHEDSRWEPPGASFSQNLAVPFGKILRINPDGSFPVDNPFFDTPGAYKGTFVIGLRNPYTLSVQPGSGLMYIDDVGAGSFEEINQAIPGVNYGWPFVEGRTEETRFTNSVYEYGHDQGCAITGGTFYNPLNAQFPASYVGKFLFADFCSGWIRVLDPTDTTRPPQDFAAGIKSPVAIATAPDGSLYYLARNQGSDAQNPGSLGKIVYTSNPGPRLTQQPQGKTIFAGDPVTFSVAADDALRYQWQRNGVNIPGATSSSYTIAQTSRSDNQAVFSVIVSNDLGSVTSNGAALTITNNRLPAATITAPAATAATVGFAPNDVIRYSGTASDAEDGTLPPAAFTWKVDFQHDTHTHPFLPATKGASSGTFTAPSTDVEAANTWLRLSLSVTDSAGQTSTVVRDIYPKGQLADMTPVGTPVNGLGPIEINRNNGNVAAGDGGPIKLGSIGYAKGIGVQAPSDIRYNLAGSCSGFFVADVGIDDAAGKQGSVIFQVYLDDVKVFDSGLMHGGDLRKSVHASIAGKRSLRLVVTDGGDGNPGDMADWAGARVEGCPASFTQGASANIDPEAVAGSDAPSLGGGGGGCAIGGDGRFDPVLPGLLALSIGVVGWRRRRKCH